MMGKSIIAVASDASAENAAPLKPSRAAVAPPRSAADRKLLQAAADLSQRRGFSRLDPLEIGERFGKAARGTTTTPSRSPTITSPEAIAAPPHTIGRPTAPGPLLPGEFGLTPIA
jgi:hypothetical protein